MSAQLREILIIGYYGMGNTGDDAMSYSLIKGIHSCCPDIRIRIAASGPMCVPESSRDRVIFIRRKPREVLRTLRGCDAIIWGGGTAIFHYPGNQWKWFKMLVRQLVLFRMAHAMGKRVFLVGIGLGPFHSAWAEYLAKCAVGVADHLSLRDPAGLLLARRWGLRSEVVGGFDLSALLVDENLGRQQHRCHARILGLSVLPYYEIFRNDPRGDHILRRHFAEAIAKCLDIHRDLTVKLFVFKGGDKDHDTDFTKSLCRDVGSPGRAEVVPYDPNPVSRLQEVGRCDFFMGMRLHASLFAYLCGLPILVLGYHEKCRYLHGALGLTEEAFLSLEEIQSEVLAVRVGRLISDPNVFRARLPLQAAQEQARGILGDLCNRL